MAMLTGDRLRTLIGREETDYTLLMSILSTYKQPRSKISAWLADGTLIRVKKGLYIFGESHARIPYCIETLANLIYGPSAISLEFALSFYGLIPERVEELTCITTKKNKHFDTPVGVFSYRHLHPKKYSMGITQYFINETHPILIATPEKALADYLSCRCQPSAFNKMEDMLLFLKNDLRADNDILLTLDTSLLREIKTQYKLEPLEWIITIIEEKVYYE
ncbi:MAG: hypothetical protein ACHQAX_06090 [Gammaproteobacteria bacterium]